MAIVQNISTEEGDVLIIKTDVPIVGIISLTSFADTTVGETGSTYFVKTFRYSINGGLTYTDWLDLTTPNISNISIEKINYFIIEYRYSRVGTVGSLEFDDVTLSGSYSPLEYPVFDSMIFSEFFTANGATVLGWALNVLEKLYKRGILPAYVTRDEEGDDSDFISFWFAITHFFAILVNYARTFENISGNTNLMREFVKGRGVYMRNNPDVEELYYVYSNYISEISKRGTSEIYRKSATIDGELLRLIDYIATDEFLFAPTTRNELGWCIGQSSPMYSGADNITNLIKGYEFTQNVVDLTKYPLINDDYISLVSGKITISGVPAGEIAGIGYSSNINSGGGGNYTYGEGIGTELIYPELLSENAIVIDPSLDYEVSFKVSKTKPLYDLSFGVALFDINQNEVLPSKITDGTSSRRFFELKKLNKTGTEYWVRGVLHAYTTELIPNDIMTIGFGQGLRLPSTAVYLVPIIIVENNTGVPLYETVSIRDIKVRPASLWFSRGLMASKNIIISFLKNRSAEYNDQKVGKIIDEELIPYNTSSLIKYL